MRRLIDGVALVTGESGGIGGAVATRLADAGATVALVGRDCARLQQVAAACAQPERHRVYPADLADAAAVRSLVGRVHGELGQVRVVVHAAGTITIGPFDSIDVAALDAQYAVNVRGPFVLTQLLLPDLRATRGHVVFVNSSAGLAARAGVSQYAATKHALKALADSLREEVHADGVRVLSVYPGRTASAMQAHVCAMEQIAYRPDEYLQPDDVADAIVSALTMPDRAEVKDISLRPMR